MFGDMAVQPKKENIPQRRRTLQKILGDPAGRP